MKRLFYVSIVTVIWLIKVEGIYHEKSVYQFKQLTGVPPDGLFGYSIAFLPIDKRLIVSAPRAHPIGKVYSCLRGKQCEEIISNELKETPITNMWLGATVATGSNFTVACAPRAVKVASDNTTKTGTFGKCYVHTKESKTKILKSLEIKDRDHVFLLEQYMDSFGWALDVNRRDSIIVGGPGMYKGRAIKYSNSNAYPTSLKPPHYVNYDFGYSVTSGHFLSNANILLYAVSTPYGINGEGMVILTGGPQVWALPRTREYSPPVGSLFGASLCPARLRGPRQREALLVGASLYAANGGVDVGAVYVYQYDPAKSKADYPFQVVHQKTILGTNDRGQFGSAIINLGDVNGDRRDDVAISAPYENDGRGSVYIYSAADILGDDPANRVRYLQKLRPEGYSTFGFSIAALRRPNNVCEDLAIGAPENNTVLIYHCLAKIIVRVLKLKHNLILNKVKKEDIGTINSSKGLFVKGKPRARKTNTYFQFESCVDVEYPAELAAVKAEIAVKVTLTHPTARIENAEKDGSLNYIITISAGIKIPICKPVNIILPEEGSSPQIQYQVSAFQNDPPINNNIFVQNHVMLSDVSTLTLTDTLWVADCASNKCEPVLSFNVNTTLSDGYVIGSTESEDVSVTVHNTGDPAYKSCVHIAVNNNVRVRRWPRACQRTGPGAGTCSPDRPIRNQTSWNTGDIKLEMKNLKSDLKELVFTVDLYEECSAELSGESRNGTKKISLKSDPRGLAVRENTNYGDIIHLSSIEITETGKQLSHIYTVSNRGFTTWVDIECSIELDKKAFFKGMTITIDTQATFKCDAVEDNNGKYMTKCNVSELKSDQKFDVIVSIYIEPGTVDWTNHEKENVTLTSYFKVSFGGKNVDHSITSVLQKKEASVPLWVIIVAALVGLIILFLIAFALYECGFLKRKKKEELEKLRRSVHRQSIRRSALERESKRNVKAMDPQSDRMNLIEESEESDPPSPSSPTDANPPPVAEDVKKPPRTATEQMPPKLAVSEVAVPEMAAPEVVIGEQSGSIPPIPVDGEKMKKEFIILGLQKNLGRYPVKPPKPRTQEMTSVKAKEQETNEESP